MTTTTAPNDLVRGLRYRRWLGRQQLVRGVTPSRPRIKYGLAPGCLGVVLVIVAIYVVMLVALAIQVALYVIAALAALLVVRPFSRFALPALRGGVFNGNAFAETPTAGMFALGAVPTTALVYPLSHGLPMLAGAAVLGGFGFRPLVRALDGKPLPTLPLSKEVDATPSVGPDLSEPGDFGLWIGEATGTLSALGHTAGLQRGSNVTLNLRDAAKNIAIFGETGTGKTTRVVNHLLVQALDFDCGGLIFDVRGDFHTTATHAAQLTGKTIQRIGVGQLGLNLLDGLTPNTAAGFLKAAFKLLGQGEGDSAFWLSLAVARSQAALAVLFHVPGAYSLKGLYDYVFDERCRKAAIAVVGDALLELQVRAADGDRDASLDARRLKSAIDYEATIAAQYTEKERSGVNRTIETALACFADPELEDAFCTDAGDQANLADVLNGSVFVVNVPRERFKAAASVIYLFLKERFFQAVNARAQLPAGPRKSRRFSSYAMSTSRSAAPGTPSSSTPRGRSASLGSLPRSRSKPTSPRSATNTRPQLSSATSRTSLRSARPSAPWSTSPANSATSTSGRSRTTPDAPTSRPSSCRRLPRSRKGTPPPSSGNDSSPRKRFAPSPRPSRRAAHRRRHRVR